ncbi:hypothetical protein [Variovorax paradoxus]|uniref:hypothetical protein n=1 Tax=Variovorax paradoxus TaxID=34073 RepID=UPI003ECC4449
MPEQSPTEHVDDVESAHAAELAQSDPELQFAALAAELGIIKPGDKLDQMQIDFAYGVAELCASIGDRYGDPSDGNAGEHIRAVYGPV